MDFTELFVPIDDFCKMFEPNFQKQLLEDGTRKRQRQTGLDLSEIMTIVIAFHTSHFRTFKHYYLYLLAYHRDDFPRLMSYSRFVRLMPRTIFPLLAYVLSCRGQVTGISFVDSTVIRVCNNKRISRHKVFDGLAEIGRSSMGWFFGFNLHLVINDRGELLSFCLTPGNIDDRQPVEKMARGLYGKLFGDKGYISRALFERLFKRGIKLVTSVRSNMKNKLMELEEKVLLRKRSLIETVNGHLKEVCQIEHTRHRSVGNFVVNLLGGLAAYCRLPKKPSLQFASVKDEPVLALP